MSPFEIVLKAKYDTTVQCTFFFFFFQRKVPLIANYNIDKTAATKMLEKEGV